MKRPARVMDYGRALEPRVSPAHEVLVLKLNPCTLAIKNGNDIKRLQADKRRMWWNVSGLRPS